MARNSGSIFTLLPPKKTLQNTLSSINDIGNNVQQIFENLESDGCRSGAQSLWVALGSQAVGLEIKKNVLPCIYNDTFTFAEGYLLGKMYKCNSLYFVHKMAWSAFCQGNAHMKPGEGCLEIQGFKLFESLPWAAGFGRMDLARSDG
jgi:hypothetical protein